MTKEEILRIKRHIEIHASRERGAIIITEVLRKAVDELEHITDLEKENAELKDQLSNVLDCFISASSGDDFEMAESAREVMEVLNIHCYRHGNVKSKLTEAKELIKNIIRVTWGEGWNYSLDWKVKAEQFVSEAEK